MFRPRVIPVLLLKNLGLVKSVQFKDYRYIGDPINAVKIFNDLKAGELVFLDITASKENKLISLDFVKNVGDEANMPFSVGGGIKTIDDIRKILNSGAEKVVINTSACENPGFIREAADAFGSSTIVVCIDVKKKLFGGYQVYTLEGQKNTGKNPVEYAKQVEEMGAGEIILQSVDKDGTMEGYDIDLVRMVSESVTIPVVALGGAGSFVHFRDAVSKGLASAVSAGSMFIYHGPRRAVLINFPTQEELKQLIL
jgi:imidazole glycerol-phosphate synthase subunit HisF